MESGTTGIKYKPLYPLQEESRGLFHVLAFLPGDCHIPDYTAKNRSGILQGMRHLR